MCDQIILKLTEEQFDTLIAGLENAACEAEFSKRFDAATEYYNLASALQEQWINQ